jgi:predicted DNA-binding transcriptional regulator YafY
MEIVAAFQAAASSRKEVSVDELAKQFGVSRATAYRALAMRQTSKPKR